MTFFRLSLLLTVLLVVSKPDYAQQPRPFPADAKLSVTLTLCSLPSTRLAVKAPPPGSLIIEDIRERKNNTTVYANITVKNVGRRAVTVDRLAWYDAVSYFVMSEYGNPVSPLFLGKADPVNDRRHFKPGQTILYQSKNLGSVSGSGWFQYDFEAGQTYRVIAVYRPVGYGGPIFCSQEVTVKVL